VKVANVMGTNDALVKFWLLKTNFIREWRFSEGKLACPRRGEDGKGEGRF